MSTTKAWYIRRFSEMDIKGPFPGGQISQEVLLGRYQLDDEVSHNKEEWLKIRDLPELLPHILSENSENPEFEDRLAAARRWADERRGVSSAVGKHPRAHESHEIKRLPNLDLKAKKKSSLFGRFVQISAMLVVVGAVIALAFQYSPEGKNKVDCFESARQGVDWNGCDLAAAHLMQAELLAANLMNTNLQKANLKGANLSNANLKYARLNLANLQQVNFTGADLKGANLIGADLSAAIFTQADLSYANFKDAIIIDANFTDARLDNAIWLDGRTCGKGSLGTCN